MAVFKKDTFEATAALVVFPPSLLPVFGSACFPLVEIFLFVASTVRNG